MLITIGKETTNDINEIQKDLPIFFLKLFIYSPIRIKIKLIEKDNCSPKLKIYKGFINKIIANVK